MRYDEARQSVASFDGRAMARTADVDFGER